MSDWVQIFDAQSEDTISIADPEIIGEEILCYSGPASNATGATNQAVYVPFCVQRPMTVLQMWCINGATVNGNIDAGIYDTGKNRLVSLGATAQAGTTAIQQLNITDTFLLPGVYYMALAWSSATATFWSGFESFSGHMRTSGVLSQAVGTLPNPAVWVANTLDHLPIFGITSRATI